MKIVTLAGGVGAARFLQGLVQVVSPASVTAIVNTGDDFVLHGLHIAPDLDIVTCTLAGVINPAQGWGIADDTFACLDWLARLGSDETWFNLGDRDLALHIRRTALLRAGQTLDQVTDQFRRALGVATRILPMSNQPVPTYIQTPDGELHFEEYLVRYRATPQIRGVRFANIEQATPAPGVLAALAVAEVIIIAPSNPIVSIGPILQVPGVRDAVRASAAPVVAVSPIVGGAAVKGPAVPLMQAQGVPVSAVGVAALYQDLLKAIVIDTVDADLAPAIADLGIQPVVTDTIMRTLDKKTALARTTLAAVGASEAQ